MSWDEEERRPREEGESVLEAIAGGIGCLAVALLPAVFIAGLALYRFHTVKDVTSATVDGMKKIEQVQNGQKPAHVIMVDDLNEDGKNDAVLTRQDGYKEPLFAVDVDGKTNFYPKEIYAKFIPDAKVDVFGIENKLNKEWTKKDVSDGGMKVPRDLDDVPSFTGMQMRSLMNTMIETLEEVNETIGPQKAVSFTESEDFNKDGKGDYILTRKDGYKIPMVGRDVNGSKTFYAGSKFNELFPDTSYDFKSVEAELNAGWKKPVHVSCEDNDLNAGADERLKKKIEGFRGEIEEFKKNLRKDKH